MTYYLQGTGQKTDRNSNVVVKLNEKKDSKFIVQFFLGDQKDHRKSIFGVIDAFFCFYFLLGQEKEAKNNSRKSPRKQGNLPIFMIEYHSSVNLGNETQK